LRPAVGADSASEYEVTKTMRAWCKANAYVRSGQHDKAIYWLSRTQAILDGEQSRWQRLDDRDVGYVLGAIGFLVLLVLFWVAKGE
jgi:hypothetical protein